MRLKASLAGLSVALLCSAFAQASSAAPAPKMAKKAYTCQPATRANLLKPPPAPKQFRDGRKASASAARKARLRGPENAPKGSFRTTALCPSTKAPVPTGSAGLSASAALPPMRMAPSRAKASAAAAQQYFYAGDAWDRTVTGIDAKLSIENPFVAPGAFTDTEIELASDDNVTDSVEFGWTKGDEFGNGPHLFTFVNKDSFNSQGVPGGDSYNTDFHAAVGAKFVPGSALTPQSTPVELEVVHYRGDFWLWFKDQYIGYLDGSFWPDGFSTARAAYAYGLVSDDASFPTTDMGNGLFSSRAGAAVIEDPAIDTNGDAVPDESLTFNNPENQVTNSSFYSVHSLNSARTILAYGGPGADH